MNPIRCTLKCNWPDLPEDMVPDYEKEFDGKTGTIVWAKKAVWAGFQVAVELDEPHSQFGSFCNIAYTAEAYIRSVNAIVEDIDALREMAEVCTWSTMRTSNGGPRPWREVGPIVEKRIQLLRQARLDAQSPTSDMEAK